MAGSYQHVKAGISTIENMGDAKEAIAELYFLVRYLADDAEIEEALNVLADIEDGHADPLQLIGGGPDLSITPGLSDYAVAYLEMKQAMGAEHGS